MMTRFFYSGVKEEEEDFLLSVTSSVSSFFHPFSLDHVEGSLRYGPNPDWFLAL